VVPISSTRPVSSMPTPGSGHGRLRGRTTEVHGLEQVLHHRLHLAGLAPEALLQRVGRRRVRLVRDDLVDQSLHMDVHEGASAAPGGDGAPVGPTPGRCPAPAARPGPPERASGRQEGMPATSEGTPAGPTQHPPPAGPSGSTGPPVRHACGQSRGGRARGRTAGEAQRGAARQHRGQGRRVRPLPGRSGHGSRTGASAAGGGAARPSTAGGRRGAVRMRRRELARQRCGPGHHRRGLPECQR